MTIAELTLRVQRAGQSRDRAQRVELLKKAHVLNSEGKIDSRFFSYTNDLSAQPPKK